jgi:hypothetical protein
MNWSALSPLEVTALWAAAAGGALWLYLHHRHPIHRRVSTLRFWKSAEITPQPRRRLRDVLALLAQVLFLLAILLALADIRIGDAQMGRSAVLIVDTSIWSKAKRAGEPAWIEKEREEALRFLNSLPSHEPVLLLQADADPTSVVSFTDNRDVLRRAIERLRPTDGVADISRALDLGVAALSGSRRGVMVYIGPGMLDEQQELRLEELRRTLQAPTSRVQFLTRLVAGPEPVENRGITGIALQRDAGRPDLWHLLANVKNYGQSGANVSLKTSVEGHPLGEDAARVAPGETTTIRKNFFLSRGGVLRAELGPPDALEADDAATLAIPSFAPVHIDIVTPNAGFGKQVGGVLATDPYVQTEVLPPGASRKASPDITIYDGMPPRPAENAIIFMGGAGAAGGKSPPVRVGGWNPQHPVTRWVRTRDVSVRNPAAIPLQSGDTVLATAGTPEKPLIVARAQPGRKALIVGFDPRRSNFPQQPAFPLLMAGAIEWMTHSVEDAAESFPAGKVALPGAVTRVLAENNTAVPFARSAQGIHLLVQETGLYRVIMPGRETRVGINAPSLPVLRWKPTEPETADVAAAPLEDAGPDLWRWLALLGVIFLWLEWVLFYRNPENRRGYSPSGRSPGDPVSGDPVAGEGTGYPVAEKMREQTGVAK